MDPHKDREKLNSVPTHSNIVFPQTSFNIEHEHVQVVECHVKIILLQKMADWEVEQEVKK